MTARFALPVLAFVLCVGCSAVQRDEHPFIGTDLALHGRQLNFGVGLRDMDDPDFGGLDDPIVLALDYIEPMGLGPLRMEGGLHYTYAEADGTSMGQDVRLKGSGLELSVGVHFSQLFGRFRPFVGAGAALAFLNLRGIDQADGTVFDDDDAGVGGYAKAGILFQVTSTSHIGLEVRHFEGGIVTLDDTALDLDYDQLLLVFGTSFGWDTFGRSYQR